MVLAEESWCSDCDQAKDGEEAYSKIVSNNYDIAVLDIEMPKMSGLEIARKFRIKKVTLKLFF